MDNKKALTNYVRRLTAGLINGGVKSVVVSPGSRSTPLAYAFASTEALTVHMHVDERSAGYFALGLAKASQEPVVLLCTSGTAASNYHPAITEAFYARIPLVVITADRPHELREVGAPQAIDQIRMYGEHVKTSVDFPLAEENSEMDQYIDRQMSRVLGVALTAPIGPVHLNVPFREPLLIDFELEAPVSTFSKRLPAEYVLNQSSEEFLIDLVSRVDNGFIIAGEMPIGTDREAFWEFVYGLQWPVLCDSLSNMRANVPEKCVPLCIDTYDALLKNDMFCDRVVPEMVIRFGAQPVSKPLSLFLKKVCPTTVVVIDESPEFRDSLGVVTHHIQTNPESVFRLKFTKSISPYAKRWITANDEANAVIQAYSGNDEDEGYYAKLLFQHIPDGSDLISGSSMPIRDVDTFFSKTSRDISIFANRGTNGIDGVVSTAFGVQASRKRDTWLLIGDLSFLHDVNGLIISRYEETNLTIVIFNNDGGGIFSYLPQAATSAYFEELFGTPTGLTFNHIAAMYEAQYAAVRSIDSFKAELSKPKEKAVRIIEVFTNRQANVESHRTLWSSIHARVNLHE